MCHRNGAAEARFRKGQELRRAFETWPTATFTAMSDEDRTTFWRAVKPLSSAETRKHAKDVLDQFEEHQEFYQDDTSFVARLAGYRFHMLICASRMAASIVQGVRGLARCDTLQDVHKYVSNQGCPVQVIFWFSGLPLPMFKRFPSDSNVPMCSTKHDINQLAFIQGCQFQVLVCLADGRLQYSNRARGNAVLDTGHDAPPTNVQSQPVLVWRFSVLS